MGRPGLGIRKTVKKYGYQYQIIRYDRNSTTYSDDGILEEPDREKQFIKMHIQPVGSGDLIADLPEGQRQTDVQRGWTLETVGKKDQIIIGDEIHTVNAVQVWPESNHTECDLLRTGELDNLED